MKSASNREIIEAARRIAAGETVFPPDIANRAETATYALQKHLLKI